MGTCRNQQAFRRYLIWAFLNSLLSCVYCSVIITRLPVCPLWENRQGMTSTLSPDTQRDFYATFTKGNITLSFRQAIKQKDGAEFAPVNLIVFSDKICFRTSECCSFSAGRHDLSHEETQRLKEIPHSPK